MTSTYLPKQAQENLRRAIYMFAIVPPEPLYSEIYEIKQYVEHEYKTHEAIRRPPHITLIPPFEAPPEFEQNLKKFTDEFCSAEQPFDIFVDGFGEFSAGTIYIKLAESTYLMSMQKRLAKEFVSVYARGKSRGPSYGFHPHITIAYKDLTRQMFEKAWHEFESKIFHRRFVLDHICLMCHTSKWVTISEGMFMAISPVQEEELDLFI